MLELIGALAILVIIGYLIAVWIDRHSAQHTKEDWKEIMRREKAK